MQEQWIKWEPVNGLIENYYVEHIFDGMDGLKIQLSEANDRKNKVNIIFEDSVYAYRSTDESFRQSTEFELGRKYGNEFYFKWAFFQVIDSSYLAWLSEQSYTITDSLSLKHFCFFAVDSVIDVINDSEPKVEMITEK